MKDLRDLKHLTIHDAGPNHRLQVLYLYWRALESGDFWCAEQGGGKRRDGRVLRAGGSTPANALPPAASVS